MDGWIQIELTQQSLTFLFSYLKTEKHCPSFQITFPSGPGDYEKPKIMQSCI